MQFLIPIDQFLSLSNMSARIIHIFPWLDNSFLPIPKYFFLFSRCVTVYPFNFWRASGLILNLGNYEWSCYKHVLLCEHMWSVSFILIETANPSFQMAWLFCIHAKTEWGHLLFHPFYALDVTSVWDFGFFHLVRRPGLYLWYLRIITGSTLRN